MQEYKTVISDGGVCILASKVIDIVTDLLMSIPALEMRYIYICIGTSRTWLFNVHRQPYYDKPKPSIEYVEQQMTCLCKFMHI